MGVASPGWLGNAKAAEVTKPTLPFHQCPAVSHDTSCGSLIVVNPDGSASLYTDFTQGPYDGDDDTLVGVENRSSQAVRGITLASTSGGASIFAFDGDGFCTSAANSPPSPTPTSPPSPGPNTPPSPSAHTPTCGSGSTGYEGPSVSFTVADPNNGTVNFGGAGLAPGDSTYFGLEAALTRFDLKPPQLSSPPSSALPSTSTSPSPQPTSQPSPPSPQSTDSNSSCSWNPFDKNSCEIAAPARWVSNHHPSWKTAINVVVGTMELGSAALLYSVAASLFTGSVLGIPVSLGSSGAGIWVALIFGGLGTTDLALGLHTWYEVFQP